MLDQGCLRTSIALLAGAALASPSAAQFTQDNTNIPNEGSATENIDFGDVDLDGDWDAAFADGGDSTNDQNRLWINQGGLQGGTVGDFVDRTAQQFPVLLDDSRDIEFVDHDADGDLDIYTSNTAQIVNQGNRWWTNAGGSQGGTLAQYVDETGLRWVGLNSANSSVADSLLLPNAVNPETFIDWSCDCDFADLDNDGDMDLFHSSYGGAFGGNVPSRVYLNDGDGHFEEFNPSGFKLAGSNMSNGNPGLWAEGTQQNNTANTSGANCDITSTALDIDLGDIDGDLDIDVLHGSRQSSPRMFVNRLEEAGSLAFRDMSNALFPANWASGGNNYEQEMQDADNDQDLDIYGLNWNGFTDIYMSNDGTGAFFGKVNLPGSGADDNEGDFLDYDNDGDLDLFIANFSGSNKLYKNQFLETGTVDYIIQQQGLGNGVSLDADCADYDNDGDYDVIIAQDNNAPNEAMLNTTGIPDTTAPTMAHLEDVIGHPAAAQDDVVRAQVYDNAPYYITWYNPTALKVRVDGMGIPDLPMVSSGGQIFRGELPGNLIGEVGYRVISRDQYGNTGSSVIKTYTNTGDPGVQSGGQTGSSVGVPIIETLTTAIAGEQLYLATDDVAPGSAGLVLVSNTDQPALDLGDGVVLNVGATIVDPILLPTTNSNGRNVISVETTPSGLSGSTIYFQYIAADGIGGATWASSQALGLTFL